MDEIICPHCGRPNLIEAVKCWYCQTTLEESMGKAQEENPVIPISDDEEVVKKALPEDESQFEQNIPEWLKRVRELKEADQPPEEDDPNWHQRDLFPSEEKPKKQKSPGKKPLNLKENTAHPKSKTKKKDDQPINSEHKNSPRQNNDADKKEQRTMENTGKDSDNLSDELPDGFTKL